MTRGSISCYALHLCFIDVATTNTNQAELVEAAETEVKGLDDMFFKKTTTTSEGIR